MAIETEGLRQLCIANGAQPQSRFVQPEADRYLIKKLSDRLVYWVSG